MSNNNPHDNSDVPPYGTPEYAEWYRKNVDPNHGQQPAKKSHKIRWTIISIAALALIGGIAGAASGGGKTKNTAHTGSTLPRYTSHDTPRPPASPTPQSDDPVTAAPTTKAPTKSPATTATTLPTRATTTHSVAPKPKPTPSPTTRVVVKPKPAPKPAVTTGEQQAINAAESYLNLDTGFSRAGLIAQLTSQYGSGFSAADATYAVDHITVDWNEQAVIAAKNYLKLGTGFSRSSLIEQLSSAYGSQFTLAQATYAADQVGLK